jgi:hypothetical protein
MCGKETEEEKIAREAAVGTGSTKEHMVKRWVSCLGHTFEDCEIERLTWHRTCWFLLFVLLALLQALCAFPLYIAFVVEYGYLIATGIAVVLGIIVALLYWEQCCRVQSKIADMYVSQLHQLTSKLVLDICSC